MDDPFATCKAPRTAALQIAFPAGHEFADPATGHSYRLRRSVVQLSAVRASDFEPLNGALPAVAGEVMPLWLQKQIWPRQHFR